MVNLPCGQRLACGDVVPLVQTGSAAGGGGVLGDENGVASHWGLPAVVSGLRRREPLPDKLAGVVQYRGRSLATQVFVFGGAQAESAAEARPRQGPEKVVDPAHVLDMIFATRVTRPGAVFQTLIAFDQCDDERARISGFVNAENYSPGCSVASGVTASPAIFPIGQAASFNGIIQPTGLSGGGIILPRFQVGETGNNTLGAVRWPTHGHGQSSGRGATPGGITPGNTAHRCTARR